MQVGDLVKLIDEPYQRGPNRPASDYKRIGILIDIQPASADDSRLLSTGWVRWASNFDWDCEFTEDLEIISASR